MAEDQEYVYVALRQANFNLEYASKYGHKSPKGAVLKVPKDVGMHWADIGLARKAKPDEQKDYEDWRETMFAESEEDDDDDEPALMGTRPQRAAQESINIRNRPPAQPSGAQIGNAKTKDDED